MTVAGFQNPRSRYARYSLYRQVLSQPERTSSIRLRGKVAMGYKSVFCCALTAVLASGGPAAAGDCGRPAAAFADCAGGSAQSYAMPRGGYFAYSATAPYGVQYSAPPAAYSAPVVYSAPYSVVPVGYSLTQPSPPSCGEPGANAAFGLGEALTTIQQVLNLVDRLRQGAKSPGQPVETQNDYHERLTAIEDYLEEKDPTFKRHKPAPAGAGKPDQPTPPAGHALAAGNGRAPAPPEEEDVAKALKRIEEKLEKLERIDAFLKKKYPGEYQ
ncbi:MAG: hypothetical protein KY476_16815 [Planctomycetes bacterium]|nr:hypothetical protein [Planctomycetota bacterium]